MSECVHDHKGQDDGNKGNGYDVEHWETDAGKLRIGTIAVNLQFLKF
jgi:hypothetical protein